MSHSADELMQIHAMLVKIQQENQRLTADNSSLTKKTTRLIADNADLESKLKISCEENQSLKEKLEIALAGLNLNRAKRFGSS